LQRRRQRNGALGVDIVVCTTHHAVLAARTRARRADHTTNLTTSRSRRFAFLRANLIHLIGWLHCVDWCTSWSSSGCASHTVYKERTLQEQRVHEVRAQSLKKTIPSARSNLHTPTCACESASGRYIVR
jgi:hypothetical protein